MIVLIDDDASILTPGISAYCSSTYGAKATYRCMVGAYPCGRPGDVFGASPPFPCGRPGEAPSGCSTRSTSCGVQAWASYNAASSRTFQASSSQVFSSCLRGNSL